MTALSSGELTTLRTTTHRHEFFLSVSVPRTLLTAQVNNASIERGDTSIAYDSGSGSGYSSIHAGQTLRVTTSYGTTEYVRIKSVSGSQSSGTLTVAANEIPWSDNDVIGVLEEYRLWTLVPRFTVDGTFYKDYSTTYTDQNDDPDPVCVAGPHVAGYMSAGSLDFTVDLTGSYAIAPGASISSTSLTADPSSGISITDNLDDTYDISVTSAGQYWLIASCTDSNGKSATRFVRVFCYDANNEPYTELSVGTLSGAWDRGGWNMDIEVFGAADSGQFADDALVVLWTRQYFDTTEQTIGDTGNVLFAGYIQSGSIKYDWDKSAVDFRAASPTQLLRDYMLTSISLEAKNNPSTWYEYLSSLTSGRAVHHLLHWHSTALDLVDIYGLASDATLLRQFAEVPGGTLASMAVQLLASIQASLVANKAGQVWLVQDAQLLDDADRAALTTTFDIADSDVIKQVVIDESPPRAAKVFLSGFAYSGGSVTNNTPILSKAPGDVYGPFGATLLDVPSQIFEDQDYANSLSGRLLARERNPYPRIELGFAGGYIGALDVTGQEWLTIDLVAGDTNRSIVWTDQKIMVRGVSCQINPAEGTLRVQVDAETEAQGAAGVTETWTTDPPTYFETAPLPEPEWPDEDFDLDDGTPPEILQPPVLGNLVTWDGTNGVYLYPVNGTAWQAINGTLASGAAHGAADPFAGLTTGYSQNSLNPAQMTLVRITASAIYITRNGGQAWLDVTPVDNPPNSWGDATAPTLAAVAFFQVSASLSAAGSFTVGVRWQEVDSGLSKWRSWILESNDYGATWSWVEFPVSGCQNYTITYDFTQDDYGFVNNAGTASRGANGWTLSGASASVQRTTFDLYWTGLVTVEFHEVFVSGAGNIFWTLNGTFTSPQDAETPTGIKDYTITRTETLSNALILDIGVYTASNKTGDVTFDWIEVSGCASPWPVTITDIRLLRCDGNYAVGVINDSELHLITIGAGLGAVASAYIGDATNAEIDAGTYSAAAFVDSDGNVYVFGNFDCTNGDTGLTGVHHVIKYDGSTWSSIESGWSTDHCGAFIAGYDSGSGARYWAIRNLGAGNCQLYSDIGSLTAVGSPIASFHVDADGFYILDGQTMAVGGQAAAGGAILYESYDGGFAWTDITGVHPSNGSIEVVRYI